MEAPAPPEADLECGLLAYSTGGRRHQGRIRGAFSDFQVEELISLDGLVRERAPGLVPVYKVTKAGIDTPHLAKEISSAIRSEVNFAGLKDKNATAVQYVSARSTRASAPARIKGSRFDAELAGFSRPVTRGMLLGNRFRIFMETAEDLTAEVERCFDACRERRVANFFGYQRFGQGGVNRMVGRAVVRGEFGEAVRLMLAEPRRGDDAEVKEARSLCAAGRYREAAKSFSAGQDLERRMASRLSDKPLDHLGALRTIPIQIRRLLVNSYQAYLFNLTLSKALEAGLDVSSAEEGDNWARLREGGLGVGKVHGVKEQAPGEGSAVPLVQIVGYAYRNYGSRFDAHLAEVIEQDEVSPGSFYVKGAEEMSSEGGFRHAPLLAVGLSSEKGETGLTLGFDLGKGEYATVLLREVLKPENPGLSGF